MPTMTVDHFAAITASNNSDTLRDCLLRSPDVASGALPVTVVRDARSMTAAYNQGLERTDRPILVLVHQDVYLPAGWLARAAAALNDLTDRHPDWEVAGPFGVRGDAPRGRVWDVGYGREFGTVLAEPAPVDSYDELLIILRRRPGYRFDPDLPGFHLYGTDIAQTALAAGRGAYAIEAPVVHNARLVSSLRGDYARAWYYMRRKWWARLPIETSVSRLSRSRWDLWKRQWSLRGRAARTDERLPDSVEQARLAGYE